MFNDSIFPKLSVGITTLVGGGTGPADGTRATTCTPARSQMMLMLQSTDDMPLNFGFTGKVRLIIYILNKFLSLTLSVSTYTCLRMDLAVIIVIY